MEAGGAVQLALVGALHAAPADVVGAAVVRVDAFLLELGLVVLVDAAHVADDVRADVAERVLAEQARLDLDALVAEAVGGELGDVFVAEARADRQALGVARLHHQPLEAGAVARRNLDQLGELVDGRLHAFHPAREDLEGVARIIARHHHAVAIGDQAAIGRDRHDRDAVVLGLGAVMLVLDHLQEEKARQQDAEGDEHHHAGDADAQLKLLQLALGIAQLRGPHHRGCSRLISSVLVPPGAAAAAAAR